MQGCHHQARRAKENSPAIDRWVRALIVSSPGRDERTTASLGGHRHAATDAVRPIPKNIKNPRNITFYALKPESTTSETSAYPWAVGRVTPCAPLLTSQRTSFPQPPPSQCFTLKKQIMQVPVFTTCYVRIQSAQDAGRVATDFPLPSTGRGIEGEGWSYPELPPVSSCISPIRGPG